MDLNKCGVGKKPNGFEQMLGWQNTVSKTAKRRAVTDEIEVLCIEHVLSVSDGNYSLQIPHTEALLLNLNSNISLWDNPTSN